MSDTYHDFHEYEIRWTPDEISWLVDGKVGRSKKRSETWNATANQWAFPQTPSRVQLSIWPGGLATNAQGTIDWAGGEIDWNSDEIKNYGYYFTTFSEVTVECYSAKTAPGTNAHKSYYYNDASGTNNTVVDSDKPTILKSFLATGTDMNKGDGSSSSSTGSAGSSQSSGVNAIPGGGSANPGGQVPGGSNANSGGSSSSGGSGSGGGSSSNSAPGCATTGFSQSCNQGGSSGGNGKQNDGARLLGVERTLGASAFAVVVGFAGLLLL